MFGKRKRECSKHLKHLLPFSTIMQQKRIQNRIVESRWTQAYVVSAAILVWVIAGFHNLAIIVPGICLLLSTYLMMELNNANALIRIYSRMVSCSYVIFATMAALIFPTIQSAIIILGFIGFYTFAFRCYQDSHTPGYTFYAFFCISMASIVWVQALYFLPALWIIMRTNILSMSPRNFIASLLGLILPYWFYAGYLIVKGDITTLFNHFTNIAVFTEPFGLKILNTNQIITLSFVLTCALIGIIHFINKKRNDNIRTRLFYQAFITINLIAIIFLFLQPQHYEALLSVLIVTTAPLIAHFIALTRTKVTNWMFLILTYTAIIITLFNLWIFLHKYL